MRYTLKRSLALPRQPHAGQPLPSRYRRAIARQDVPLAGLATDYLSGGMSCRRRCGPGAWRARRGNIRMRWRAWETPCRALGAGTLILIAAIAAAPSAVAAQQPADTSQPPPAPPAPAATQPSASP